MERWKIEWDKQIEDLDGKRKVDQEQLLNMLRFDNQKLVVKLLRLYLERCMWKQNMAFFQFRRFMPEGKQCMCELKRMFEDRLKNMNQVIGKVEKLKGKEIVVPEGGMNYSWEHICPGNQA